MMKHIARFIVKNRLIFFVAFLALTVFAVLKIPEVNISYDMTEYLPEDSDTSVAITIMEEEFQSNATMSIMLKNVLRDEVQTVVDKLVAIDGVKTVMFNGDENDYKDGNALLTVLLTYGEIDPKTSVAIDEMRAAISECDFAMNGSAFSTKSLKHAVYEQIPKILIISCLIIVGVLFFTGKSYIEPIIFVIVIGASVLINLGTNAFLPSVSFLTNAICSIMQLAIAMDYAIIFLHRYMEERSKFPTAEGALTEALAESISSITSSSLTTVAGLAAITILQFRLGYDLGIVLIKGTVISMVTVFLFMPSLILMFEGAIDKTQHKSFLPEFKRLPKMLISTKKIIPIIIVAIICFCAVAQTGITYDYGITSLGVNSDPVTKTENEEIESVFGQASMMVIIVPKGDYDKEAELTALLSELEYDGEKITKTIQSLASTPLNTVYTAKQLADEYGVSQDIVRILFRLLDLNTDAKVYLRDLLFTAYEKRDTYPFRLYNPEIESLYDQAVEGIKLLESANYSRVLLTLEAESDSEAAFYIAEHIRESISSIYTDFYIGGDTLTMYDIRSTFGDDFTRSSLLTVFLILIILILTFSSPLIAVILLFVIQGAIWVNMAITVAVAKSVFFICPIMVNCIQMGATIDYAIMLTTRFKKFRQLGQSAEQSIHSAMNASMTTILTSGSILVIAGLIVGLVSSVSVISVIGKLLSRGTLFSIIFVVFLLPQLLLLFDRKKNPDNAQADSPLSDENAACADNTDDELAIDDACNPPSDDNLPPQNETVNKDELPQGNQAI